ncbi:MAG: ORF6N domain-containing protein [Verrucomicrobia bacterium]|nr:ORF6N domain-containing protein [Verrucomicrobiota bacterium]
MNTQHQIQLVPAERIEELIHVAREEKVLLDADLARLYGVTTGNLNKAVVRNKGRFPSDFMFQLTDEETAALIFQSGRSKQRGGRRHNPCVFTEKMLCRAV